MVMHSCIWRDNDIPHLHHCFGPCHWNGLVAWDCLSFSSPFLCLMLATLTSSFLGISPPCSISYWWIWYTPIFSFCPLTEAEVSKLLLSSHPITCPLDPIPSHLLQAISPTLLPALTHIINTSLLTGIFPTAFKQARVTPLLKKPTLNTSLLENYRPVSLLPFIAKTLERVVFNQVSLFLSQNNKLDAK